MKYILVVLLVFLVGCCCSGNLKSQFFTDEAEPTHLILENISDNPEMLTNITEFLMSMIGTKSVAFSHDENITLITVMSTYQRPAPVWRELLDIFPIEVYGIQ
jgi:hypothetical protein